LSYYLQKDEVKSEEVRVGSLEEKNPEWNLKIIRSNQSVRVIYSRSYSCHLYVDSLVEDQFYHRVKYPSGSRHAKYHDSSNKEMKKLLMPLDSEIQKDIHNYYRK
jgi:hypothetical protein